jgi:ribosome assembly protein YihI (activator of Der GTPase)
MPPAGQAGKGSSPEGNDMKTPRLMKKEKLVFFAEQLQHLLYLESDDSWNPEKKWDADTLDEIKDIMQRFGLVPDKAASAAARPAPKKRASRGR